jgi:hypothetical protein
MMAARAYLGRGWAISLVPALLALASPAEAASGLGLISNGALGNVEIFNSSLINTDNSWLYVAGSSGGYAPDRLLDSRIVTQSNGSQIRVFDFGSLTVDASYTLTFAGSLSAALVASGDITINGTIVANSNSLAGGTHGASAPGATGGLLGSGSGRRIDSPCCGYDMASGGGGGGKGSSGQQGNSGSLFPSFAPNGAGGLGGSADPTPHILSGGGGGAGGVDGTDFCCFTQGGDGGAGGGAVLFATPGNLTVGVTGSITANGARGSDPNNGTGGAGGGGAGGAIWFDVDGIWTNRGTISAVGGSGGHGHVFDGPILTDFGNGGFGAGGQIVIDPSAIYNFGTIDVSDGGGGSEQGGKVALISNLVVNSGSILGAAAVPEPGSWMLMVGGFGLCGAALRRQQKAAAA